ncbi:MAG: hypothetical protein LBH07_03770 [Treponema sp.]|nr:hypothetical protein [Treponema sp.]
MSKFNIPVLNLCHQCIRCKKLWFYIIIIVIYNPCLFSQEESVEAETAEVETEYVTEFVIRSINYKITGKTKESALERLADFKTGVRFSGWAALEKYLAEKIQDLYNIRALEAEESSVHYSLGEAEEDGVIPVYLEISVTDSTSLIIIPEPKYDSNAGFTLSLKARDYNFLGTLAPVKLDLVWGSDDKDRNSLGFLTEITIPFKAFYHYWIFTSYNEYYYYRTGEPYYNKNVLGLALELPVLDTLFTFGFEQGLVIHEENTDRIASITRQADSSEPGLRIRKPPSDINNIDEYHDWYLFSKPYVDWKIPMPLRVGKFGRLVYSPGVYGIVKYQPGGDPGDYRRGPGAGIDQEIGFKKINWIGNYREGLGVSLFNKNEYNFFRQDWINSLGFLAEGHIAVSRFFGISGRLMYTRWFNDFYDLAGDVIRGYKDNELYARERLSLNLDFPVRLIRFVPSEWKENPKYRYFDFEQHWSPFVDLVLADSSNGNNKPDSNQLIPNKYQLKKEDLISGAGLEIITFPLKWRSFYLRGSIGFNIQEFHRTKKLPKGIYREIYIGMGHYY